MQKHLKSFHELHHTHKMTHKVLSLVTFTILIVLAVYGMQRVRASQDTYASVPNGSTNVCHKVGTDYTKQANLVSCTTHEKVCETAYGVLVGCQTKRAIEMN